MKHILSAMRTDEAIAKWRAASSILAMFDGSAGFACTEVDHYIGFGLTEAEADQLRHHIVVLAKEAANAK